MQIKECYVSKNGISCFTNLNTLINVKDITFKSIKIQKILMQILFYFI